MAEPGVSSLVVLSVDKFGIVTLHLGYEPIRIGVESHSHRTQYQNALNVTPCLISAKREMLEIWRDGY